MVWLFQTFFRFFFAMLASGSFCLHQVSSRKIWKSSDFFWLFSIFLSGSLYFARIFPNKYLPEKIQSGRKILNFFQFFLRSSRNPGRLRTSIFPKTLKIAALFLIFSIFSNYSFPAAELITDLTKQVSFQKSPKWFRFFWFFLKNLFYCLDFHTSIFPETGDRGPLFLNFFHFSFQQHRYVEKASRKTKKNII